MCRRNEPGARCATGAYATPAWIGAYRDGEWKGKYHGARVPVLISYSEGMVDWLKKANQANDPSRSQPAWCRTAP